MVEARHSGEHGFTFVELLIVVAIIGLLAAIAIPQFAAYRQRAHDATCLSDLKNFKKVMEAYRSDNQDYPVFAGAVVTSAAPIADAGGEVLYQLSNGVEGVIESTVTSYAIATWHLHGGKWFAVASDSSYVFSLEQAGPVVLAASDASAFAAWVKQ